MNGKVDDALESERDFLLESLRRLDEDHESGALSDSEYVDLRDEQTVRAAAVLARLNDHQPQVQPGLQKLKTFRIRVEPKTVYWIGGVGAFLIVALLGLFGAAGGRLTGENATGSTNADSNTLIARAQQQSGKGKVADAVKTYDQVLKQDPGNVQALTYRGWLIRLAGLPQEGLDSIDRALAINAKYPDADFFKGFILFRDRQDPKAAVPEFQEFLADNPPADMVPLVQQTLQDAQAEAAQQK